MALAVICTAGAARADSFWEWLEEDDSAGDTPIATPYLPPQATPAPQATFAAEEAIPDCSLTDDGWLRVYLKSLNAPSRLNLVLQADYAVEGDRGFRFDRGTAVALYLEGGEVWLSAGGVTIDMGLAVTLTRLDAADDCGLYIQESEFPNLYCGDLSVTAMANGLRPVLRIFIEDYLRGVVAYEMSDSFPLEALKTQAVAARTYALQRKRSAGRRDYDLVDTTADQVYKGYDPQYANVVEAVNATRGVVCVYDNAPAICYYTASNGGQTALPSQVWGSAEAADKYLAMADDPYDLENPRCLTSELTFSATCEGSLKLRDMLAAGLERVMAEEGFPPDNWAFDAIVAIEPVNPRFEGSKMYDGLAFDLRVRAVESALATPTPEPTPEASPEATAQTAAPEPTAEMSVAPDTERWVVLPDTRRVVLSVYDDIKDGLAMGLNGADCELISVETEAAPDGTAAAFTLVMRRYGHGVGMSQRGAQWMAGHYDMDYLSILRFYYPGVSIERMVWPEAEAPAEAEPIGAARPKPTPTPTPKPLPRLRSGEHYATVTATMLNVREHPTTSARILDMLDQGARLIVRGPADADGWVSVKTGDVEGYVVESYLKAE